MSLSDCPVLIEQSILGFVVLAIHVLYNTGRFCSDFVAMQVVYSI